jgi:hypothetical protein
MVDRENVEDILLDLWAVIGIDKPANHEKIVDFVVNDIGEAADPERWQSGDVEIAFRRFLEKTA